MKLNYQIALNEFGLIFNSTTKETFAANTVGTDILNCIKLGISRSQIEEKILAKYDIDKDTLDNDITEFFHDLNMNHLITPL